MNSHVGPGEAIASPLPGPLADDCMYLNAGARNIVLGLCLSPNEYVTGSNVDKVLNGLLPSGSEHRVPKGYSRNLLLQLPTTAVRIDDAEPPLLFTSTDQNELVFKPFGALVARLCQDFDVAPHDLTGPRAKPKTSEGIPAYAARLRIYRELHNHGAPMEPLELAIQAHLKPSVAHNHIGRLIDAGILDGIETGRRETYPTYKLAEATQETDEPLMGDHLVGADTKWREQTRTLARACLHFIRSRGGEELSVMGIHAELADQTVIDETVRSTQIHRQRLLINQAMQWLVNNGLATEVSPAKGKIDYVRLSELGLEVTKRYLQLVDLMTAFDRRFVRSGEREASKAQDDTRLLGWLMGVDFEKGAITKRQFDREDELLAALSTNDEGLGTENLEELTGLKQSRIHNQLRQLISDGRVVAIKAGRRKIYRLV